MLEAPSVTGDKAKPAIVEPCLIAFAVT